MSIEMFKRNLIQFIDELYKQSSYDEFILAHIYVENKICIKELMDTCVSQYQILKSNVLSKNMDDVFQNTLLKEYSIFLRKLWYSSLLDDSDKEVIWKWMELILYDIERYQTMCEQQLKIKKND